MTDYHVSFFNEDGKENCRFVYDEAIDAISVFLDFCLEIRRDVSEDDRTFYLFKIYDVFEVDGPSVIALESDKLTIAVVKCEDVLCFNPLDN